MSRFMKKGITILSISLLLFSIFGLCLFVGILFSKKQNSSDPSGVSNAKYKYYQFNTKTRESTSGFATYPSSEEDEIYFSNSKTGIYGLITNTDHQPYKCTGSCYCEVKEDETRRSTFAGSDVLKRGVIFLLTAISSSVAMNIAKNKFKDECSGVLQNSCSSESIRSEVEVCDPLMTTSSDTLDESENDKEILEAKEMFDKYWEEKNLADYTVWNCEGNCITRTSKMKHKEAEIARAEAKCEERTLKRKLTLEKNPFQSLYFGLDEVEMKFVNEDLVEFCTDYEVEYEMILPKTGKYAKQKIQPCVHGMDDHEAGYDHMKKVNKYVRCEFVGDEIH